MDRLKEEHKSTRVREDLCSESTSRRPAAVYRVGTQDEPPYDKERVDIGKTPCGLQRLNKGYQRQQAGSHI